MRKLGLTFLIGSMAFVPYAAISQEAAPSPDDYVCAFTGECPEAEEEAAAATDTAQPNSSPRVSATRSFSLSTTTPSRPKASSTSTSRQRTASSNRQRTQRPTNRPVAVQPGRVDLRLSFGTGSSALTAAAQAQIRAFAEALKRPQLSSIRVRIEGHTDSSGSRATNMSLSQRRAQAVADYLVGQGVPLERLEVRGLGPDQPLPGRPASAGENRRVEAVRIS
jgi:outer membrane protein OmpA-like peptidoglycan-associated protein